MEVAFDFLGGKPMGAFSRNVGQMTWGGSINVTYHLRKTPVAVGADLFLIGYGSEPGRAITDTGVETIENEDYQYNILSPHLVLRYELGGYSFHPFIEGLVGFKYLFTYSSIGKGNSFPIPVGNTFIYIEDSDTRRHAHDIASSYGVGAGLNIPIVQIKKDNNGEKAPISLNLGIRLRYLFGGQADYLRKGSIEVVQNRFVYEHFRSRTDLLFLNVGLIIRPASR